PGDTVPLRVSTTGQTWELEVGRDGAKSWEVPEKPGSARPGAGAAAPDWTQVELENAAVRVRRQSGEIDLWRVEKARAEMDRGLRDVRIEATLERNGHPLHAAARFADLSRLGLAGATSQGTIDLDWGGTQVALAGNLPLDHGLESGTFDATVKSASLGDMLGFFGLRERRTAPFEARAKVTKSRDEIALRSLAIALGRQRVEGEFRWTLAGSPRRFAGTLRSDALDWTQAFLDAGDAKPQPPPEGEMFPVRPLPWPMLAAMDGKRGTLDLAFGKLKLPDGIELSNAKGRMAIDGDHLVLDPVSAQLLGGSGKATFKLEARGKKAQVELDADGVLLERWFHERHRPVRFTGGPMKVKASISTAGASMKELAAAMTGPVSIRMGPGVYSSKVAGDWEALMVRFSKKDSAEEIDFECGAASLPFQSGRASGKDIIAARSRESRLVVSGDVDLREEAVDLRGRLRPKPAQGIGLATIADDLMITGPIRKMKVKLDPESKPKVIAKAAGAIVTAGVSLLASAASNDASRDPDPCEAVFGRKHPARD
ncbi:MAG TPA: AsmA-like C-terminal region-containing protein, partial [Usitatibacter sp.]|nr:AsmA-like C-terminal region-containing protein [Usitatibacter sp.]